jgi:hypothetical protein
VQNDHFGGNETNENQITYFPIGLVAALEAFQPRAYKPSCLTEYDIYQEFYFPALFSLEKKKKSVCFA